MADYSKMTDADFDRILLEVMQEHSMAQILALPGIYEVVSEKFNNAILDRWEAEQPEPDDEEDEDDEDAELTCSSP